jgi:hypothetical protein
LSSTFGSWSSSGTTSSGFSFSGGFFSLGLLTWKAFFTGLFVLSIDAILIIFSWWWWWGSWLDLGVAARVDFAFDFEIDLDWIGLTLSESFFSSLGELSSVCLLILSITFWWNHVWDISWMWLDIGQMFFVTIWGILSISGEVDLIVLIEVPCMVSNNVWDDL